MRSGVSNKFVANVKSVYSSVKLRIRTGGVLSDAFDNFLGVKQGEPLSPLLFLFFINDIIQDLSTDVNNSDICTVNGYMIYLILFADDTLLFAKSPRALQLLLDKLKKYCTKWNIVVNTDKIKIVIFRNGWKNETDKFFFNDMEIEIVKPYVYLGVLMHFNGKFQQTQLRVSQQGVRALSALLNSLKKLYISANQKCYLFNSMVSPVLNFGSEI